MLKLQRFRPPDELPDRHAANWLLVSVTAVSALHVQRLPLWLTLGVACLTTWRYLIENHGWRHPGRLIRWGLVLVAAVAVVRTYGTVFGRDAGVALLAVLTGLKLLEMRTMRDSLIAVFLLYFLTLAAFLFSQSLTTAGLALVVTVVTTTALIRLSQPGMAAGDSLRLAAAILWRAAPIMLVIYLLFPRIQGSLWGLPHDAFGARTGLTDQVTPGSISQLLESDAIAFRAKFLGTAPDTTELYWRALVLSDTDGRRWSRADHGKHAPAARLPSGDRPVRYEVDYEGSGRRWLVALDLPASVPRGARARPGFVLEAEHPVRHRFRYAVTSYLRYDTGELAPVLREHNLQTPIPPSPRVAALVRELRLTADPVAAVLRFFRDEDFYYTLTPPPLGNDPLDTFLFETRRGYCEYYAAAFAALMRHVGVPSRLVIGYQGGEWNAAGGYFMVRQSDAHAWTEVWQQNRGWVRVDPTAAVAPERIELGVEALRTLLAQGARLGELEPSALHALLRRPLWIAPWHSLRLRWDAFNSDWNRWVMAYGPENQRRFLRWLGFRTPSWTQMVGTLAGAVALVLLLLAATLWRPRRRPDPAVAAYKRVSNQLARVGLARRDQEGPLAFYDRISALRPDLARDLRAISELYIQLRYGHGSSPALLADLQSRARRFRVPRHVPTLEVGR